MSSGMDSLYRFYCASLRSIFRERLFRDFVHFVAAEAADNTPGVEVSVAPCALVLVSLHINSRASLYLKPSSLISPRLVLTPQMMWMFMKECPGPQQDSYIRLFPDLLVAFEQLEALSRFSLD